jgi:hypothetical protein
VEDLCLKKHDKASIREDSSKEEEMIDKAYY